MLYTESIAVTDLQVITPFFKLTEEREVSPRSFHSLSFRFSGKAYIGSLLSSEGSLTLIPKGCAYTTSIPEEGSAVVAHFDTLGNPFGKEPLVLEGKGALTENLFRELESATRSRANFNFLQMSVFYRILHEVFCQQESASFPLRIVRAREKMESSFSDPNLNVSSLARECGVSCAYLRREFRSCFGVSPSAYLRKIRTENAKALLISGYFGIGEIGEKCGYESPSYFSAAFKKEVGVTPTEYRETRE